MAKELPRNNKKSIDKISVAWYNKDTKRERGNSNDKRADDR